MPWADPKARFTLLFEALAIRVLKETSVSGGAKLLGISWDEAHGIMKRAVERGLDARDVLDLRVIDVDEKYAGRGRGIFPLIYDIRGGRVIDIIEGRGDFFLKLEPQ